jgi:hypothetical protein
MQLALLQELTLPRQLVLYAFQSPQAGQQLQWQPTQHWQQRQHRLPEQLHPSCEAMPPSFVPFSLQQAWWQQVPQLLHQCSRQQRP